MFIVVYFTYTLKQILALITVIEMLWGFYFF